MFARVEDPFVVQAARPRFRRRMVSNNEWGRAPPFFPDRGEFLEVDDGHDMRRARSQNGRLYAPHPSALPVVINNNIRQEELLQMRGRPVSMHEPEMDHDREHAQHPHRPHSRDPSPRHMWHHEQENDQMKKELEAFKKEKERKEQEQRIKDQLILQRAREEQKAREEADMKKKIQEEAIKEWKNKELVRIAEEDKKKREEAEKKKKLEEEAIKRWQREQKDKADKEKQEKEEKEKEYKERLKRDLGLSDTQVAKVISKENSAALDLKRTTYMKIARRHISIETLRVFNLPYKLDDVSKMPHPKVR